MMIRKFEDHKYAQATIIEYTNGAKALISYKTPVVYVDEEGWLIVHGLYSMTTIKHIGWFMRELGLTYQLAKELYKAHESYNIYTGEVIEND